MLAFESDEVDEHVGAVSDRIPKSLLVSAVDADVLHTLRHFAFSAAGDNDLPAALPKPGDQAATRLTAATEEKRASRHAWTIAA